MYRVYSLCSFGAGGFTAQSQSLIEERALRAWRPTTHRYFYYREGNSDLVSFNVDLEGGELGEETGKDSDARSLRARRKSKFTEE